MEKITSKHLSRYAALTDINTLYGQKEKARIASMKEGGLERSSLISQTEDAYNTRVKAEFEAVHKEVEQTEKDVSSDYTKYLEEMAALKKSTLADRDNILKESEKVTESIIFYIFSYKCI